MAACPSQCAPMHVRRHCGGLVTTHHLASMLSTARRLRSTRSPCSRHLHVRAACHVESPFASSMLSSSRRQPPSTLPYCAAVDRAVPLHLERSSSCATGASTFQPRPAPSRRRSSGTKGCYRSCAAHRLGPPRPQPMLVLLRPHRRRLEHCVNAGRLPASTPGRQRPPTAPSTLFPFG
jgi:hypothetical protein